jgi:hypothetical protein
MLTGETEVATQPVGLSTWDIKEFTGLLEELLRGSCHIPLRNEIADLIFNSLPLSNQSSEARAYLLAFVFHSFQEEEFHSLNCVKPLSYSITFFPFFVTVAI